MPGCSHCSHRQDSKSSERETEGDRTATYQLEQSHCSQSLKSLRSSLRRASARCRSGDPEEGSSGLFSGNSSSRMRMISADSTTSSPLISTAGSRPEGTCTYALSNRKSLLVVDSLFMFQVSSLEQNSAFKSLKRLL